jgi:hypothetical protein
MLKKKISATKTDSRANKIYELQPTINKHLKSGLKKHTVSSAQLPLSLWKRIKTEEEFESKDISEGIQNELNEVLEDLNDT